MTTIEFFYLTLCLVAFAAFACALAYNAVSWKSWSAQRAAPAPAPKQNAKDGMQAKIAA